MSEILYVYQKGVYVNLTNKCSANCVFCIRCKKSGVGGNDLFLERDPTLEELIEVVDAFDFSAYEELVFCGYGEPTCALENLLELAKYFKQNHTQKIRVDTNGLGRLYHGRDILPELNQVVDGYSISLNAPDAKRYQELVRTPYEGAYEAMLDFARDAKNAGKKVTFSVVTILGKDEINKCHQIAESYGIPLKIREFEEK